MYFDAILRTGWEWLNTRCIYLPITRKYIGTVRLVSVYDCQFLTSDDLNHWSLEKFAYRLRLLENVHAHFDFSFLFSSYEIDGQTDGQDL